MPGSNTTWDDVLTPSPAPQEGAAPMVPAARPQAKRTMGWDDVLTTPQRALQPPAPPSAPQVTAPSAATRQAKPNKTVGWNDLLSAPAVHAAPRLPTQEPQRATPTPVFGPQDVTGPQNTIGPYQPKLWDRVVNAVTSGIPRYSSRTVYNPKHGQMQLISPEEAMTPSEQQRHPILTGVGEVAGGLTTPENVAIIAATGGLGELPGAAAMIPRLVSAGFSLQSIYQAASMYPAIRDAFARGDTSEAKRLLTHAGLNLGIGALAGRHALKGRGLGAKAPAVETQVPGEAAPAAATNVQEQPIQPQPKLPADESIGQPIVPRTEGAPAPSEQVAPAARQPADLADTQRAGATWDDVLRQPEQPAAGSEAAGQVAAPTSGRNVPSTWEDVLGRAQIEAKPQGSEVAAPQQQPPRARISTARQPIALRSQQATPGEYGVESAVKTPTSDIPAKYKLVEASDLQPSHNAETFAPNPNYPPGVQERAYQTSKEAQNRVIQQAQNYDPRYTVNTNPDAVNGPPIVTPDGTVLGGNSRTMSTQRLYARGQGDTYRDYLRENAQQFGLTPDAVGKMRSPVLVREIPAPADVEAARRLGSELNKNMTGALGTSERAVSAGKSITPQSLSAISGMLDDLGPDSSIRDLLREHGRDVISMLTRDGAITERERPQFIDTATGGLSEEGKQFAERALLGTVVDDPTLMERAPKSVLNKLDGSLADIASVAPRTDEYNLLPLVREAIAEHADIAARGLDVETYLAQRGMFGPERNPAVDAIVRKLAEKPKNVRAAFRSFVRDANAAQQGQGFLAIMESPTAAEAFNAAFGTDLAPADYEQSVIHSLEREATKGTEYAANRPGAEAEAFPAHGRVRPEPSQPAPSGPAAGNEPTAAETDRSLFPPTHGAVGEGGTLFAHTPFSVAKVALDRLNKFYDEKIAEPFIQNILKTGRTHPEVERADPELADDLRLLDNAPKYFRQKARAIIRNVTAGLGREQERLFTLMADADSRENLRANHPEEYRQAQSDPAIQAALKKYRPEERKLTEAREALGGKTIDDDYLRRVYDKYTAGINKRDSSGKGITAYDRVIRPQRADKLGREAEAEYHYQNGLHEFGPAFGTKYVATMTKVTRDQAAREFLSKATALEQGDDFPRQIEYNGKVYYSPDAARDIREAGKRRVETYGTYSPTPFPSKETPQRNLSFAANRYLGPRAVTDALNGLDAPGASDPSSIKRFFQEQTVGLGFGVPHMFNILRRVTQSAPGGAINPAGWVRALKVAFSRELKARGISGVDDPTFDRLARFGAISSDSEVSSFKKFIGGNLNPANWIRPFSKIGHDILFKPGALDQRARLYIADLVKSQHPEFSDSKITQAVNEQLGNYNRANWTKMQTKLARFVLFPGWDMSSFNWVLRHPIKTSVPPALLIWTANQAINAMGGNRESEKNDFFAIHAGNRAFSTGLIREPLGRVLGGPPLRFAQALVEGKSPSRAVTEASRGLATDVTHPLGMLRPDLGLAIELGTNRERIGGAREITQSSDFSTPGRILPNAGLDKILWHAATRMLPQFGRVAQATEDTGKIDIPQALGGNLGVYNYKVDAQDRLRKKMAVASDYAQSKTAVMRRDPQALREMFTNDPDAAVYLAFRPYIQQSLGQLRKIDQAKEIISTSAEAPERKRAAIAALEKAREQEMTRADKVDRAVDLVLKRVHERRSSGVPLIAKPSAINRAPAINVPRVIGPPIQMGNERQREQ